MDPIMMTFKLRRRDVVRMYVGVAFGALADFILGDLSWLKLR